MTLEQQVSNLELSKKLCELGVKQESLFYWGRDHNKSHYKKGEWDDWGAWYIKFGMDFSGDKIEVFSAFTVAELGEMLPYSIMKNNNQYTLYLPTDDGQKIDSKTFGYVNHNAGTLPWDWLFCKNVCGTEADARAKMLIYLLENKLVTL